MTIEKPTLRDRGYQQVVFWCDNRAHALLLRCVYPLFHVANFPNYMVIYIHDLFTSLCEFFECAHFPDASA